MHGAQEPHLVRHVVCLTYVYFLHGVGPIGTDDIDVWKWGAIGGGCLVRLVDNGNV